MLFVLIRIGWYIKSWCKMGLLPLHYNSRGPGHTASYASNIGSNQAAHSFHWLEKLANNAESSIFQSQKSPCYGRFRENRFKLPQNRLSQTCISALDYSNFILWVILDYNIVLMHDHWYKHARVEPRTRKRYLSCISHLHFHKTMILFVKYRIFP